MAAPLLKRYLVFTSTSRIIGMGEEKLLLGINTGCSVDNARVGLPNFLNFFGRPFGDFVAVRDFAKLDNGNFKVISDKLFTSFMLPKDEVIFFNDLSIMRSSTHTPEKMQIERNFSLENVFIKIHCYGVTIKGQTYLSKQSLDNGVVRPSLRDNEWFILQNPEFIDETGNHFDETVELSAIGKKIGIEIDHLLVRLDKVSLGI